ncbi:MAG TPA: ABC transporter permease [Anaerolineaceae bacterium]|nr:ABC transporter permease [Anaerolineaceae bacterium]
MQNILQRYRSTSFDTQSVLKILMILVGLVLLASAFSQGVFLQPKNLVNLIYQNALLIVIALGQMLVIITGGIDLSVGSMLAISSVLVVLFQDYGLPASIAIALIASVAFGLVNGFLVTYVRLPAFVVTLATMQIISSIAKVLSGGGAIYTGLHGAEIPVGLGEFYKNTLAGIPYPLFVCLIVIGLAALYLRSSIGHYTFSIGGNERAAYLSGIPTRLVKMAVYVISAALCCLGGVLFVARVGMGDPQTGTWIPLDSIAAVSIGGASLSGGTGTILGTLIGVVILSVLNNIMNLLGVPPTLQPAIKGIVILLAVYLNSARKQN